MEQEVKDFGRFFALLKKMPYRIEEYERRSLIVQATGGRTNSLREMTRAEYDEMCDQLEGRVWRKTSSLRYRRSCVLRQMQKMGVDTTDWARVDALCLDARIAGKRFAQLSENELRDVEVRLRSIERRGGLRSSGEPSGTVTGEKRATVSHGTRGAGATYIIMNMSSSKVAN